MNKKVLISIILIIAVCLSSFLIFAQTNDFSGIFNKYKDKLAITEEEFIEKGKEHDPNDLLYASSIADQLGMTVDEIMSYIVPGYDPKELFIQLWNMKNPGSDRFDPELDMTCCDDHGHEEVVFYSSDPNVYEPIDEEERRLKEEEERRVNEEKLIREAEENMKNYMSPLAPFADLPTDQFLEAIKDLKKYNDDHDYHYHYQFSLLNTKSLTKADVFLEICSDILCINNVGDYIYSKEVSVDEDYLLSVKSTMKMDTDMIAFFDDSYYKTDKGVKYTEPEVKIESAEYLSDDEALFATRHFSYRLSNEVKNQLRHINEKHDCVYLYHSTIVDNEKGTVRDIYRKSCLHDACKEDYLKLYMTSDKQLSKSLSDTNHIKKVSPSVNQYIDPSKWNVGKEGNSELNSVSINEPLILLTDHEAKIYSLMTDKETFDTMEQFFYRYSLYNTKDNTYRDYYEKIIGNESKGFFATKSRKGDFDPYEIFAEDFGENILYILNPNLIETQEDGQKGFSSILMLDYDFKIDDKGDIIEEE